MLLGVARISAQTVRSYLMIKVFYGEDRVRAKKDIEAYLGPNYEIIDCAELTPLDLPNIFLGISLFAKTRSILLRDFTANKAIFEKLPDYLQTQHKIALFETKLDKRSATYKTLKDQIVFTEYKLPQNPDFNLVFSIYRTAKNDGQKAIAMLKKIEPNEEPMMFFGLLVSQAIKDFAAKQGSTEKRVLKELSQTDLKLKSSSIQPWLLIESFLLQLSLLK